MKNDGVIWTQKFGQPDSFTVLSAQNIRINSNCLYNPFDKHLTASFCNIATMENVRVY